VKELISKNVEFHTYKPKQERSFKLVFKHIQVSANLDNIEKHIKELRQTVINIWNVKKHDTKKTLHMFYVELKSKSNNTDIYKSVHYSNAEYI
jgi:hypothetical protein